MLAITRSVTFTRGIDSKVAAERLSIYSHGSAHFPIAASLDEMMLENTGPTAWHILC